jgi:hypothetical protein
VHAVNSPLLAQAQQGRLLGVAKVRSTLSTLEGRFAAQEVLVLIPNRTHTLPLPHLLPMPTEVFSNIPRSSAPRLLQPLEFDASGQNALLLDDVCVSGATFSVARGLLQGASITTLACKGKADFVLFPEVASCVLFPWRLE